MIPLRTRVAISNALLILLNILAFLYELPLSPRAGQSLVYTFGLSPSFSIISTTQGR